MLQIDNTIISLDLIEKKFICNLSKCHGSCCIEGDSGAPLELKEKQQLIKYYPIIKQYMNAAGIDAVNKQGLFYTDSEGDDVTALINNKECAYLIYEGKTAICAIEKAYLDKKIDFRKPISCFLYPVRIKQYSSFIAVNYDVWDICEPARIFGRKEGVPVYKFLKEPLIQKFGEEWYEQLTFAAENIKK